MKATMSNIGKQDSQNDYMHIDRRKKTSEHTLSLTPIFLQSLEKIHPAACNKHQIELYNELQIIELFYKIHNSQPHK
jgi:hypothetical protein